MHVQSLKNFAASNGLAENFFEYAKISNIFLQASAGEMLSLVLNKQNFLMSVLKVL